MPRLAIKDFELANPLYRGASVTFYTVAAGVKTATKATLYAGSSGTAQLANPQKLSAHGRFSQPVYIGEAVIGAVDGIGIPTHDTGIITPAPTFRVSSAGAVQYSFDGGVSWEETGDFFFRDRGDWAAATTYERTDISRFAGVPYVAQSDHVSTASFAADLASGKWKLLLAQVDSVPSLTELRALSAPTFPVVIIVRGFAASGDGGGGLYWWDSASSTADDGGTVIQLNAGGVGRFKKLF